MKNSYLVVGLISLLATHLNAITEEEFLTQYSPTLRSRNVNIEDIRALVPKLPDAIGETDVDSILSLVQEASSASDRNLIVQFLQDQYEKNQVFMPDVLKSLVGISSAEQRPNTIFTSRDLVQETMTGKDIAEIFTAMGEITILARQNEVSGLVQHYISSKTMQGIEVAKIIRHAREYFRYRVRGAKQFETFLAERERLERVAGEMAQIQSQLNQVTQGYDLTLAESPDPEGTARRVTRWYQRQPDCLVIDGPCPALDLLLAEGSGQRQDHPSCFRRLMAMLSFGYFR